MKLVTATILVALAAACGGAPMSATDPGQPLDIERIHQAGRVKLSIPHDWQVDDSAGDTLTITAPDRTVSLEVTLIDGQDLAAALVGVAAGMLIGYDDLELVGSPESASINGMSALFQDGSGRYHGNEVALSLGLIDTPAQKYLLVVGEAEPGGFEAHRRAIRHFIEGIRPM
ncbi:MAG TPA: hypothetical protein VLX92_12030 [Kofleriaceae bacterium]|nr:hypothetical protein [Kofleriaceae bacterium]